MHLVSPIRRVLYGLFCGPLWAAAVTAQTVIPDGTVPTQVQFAPDGEGIVVTGGSSRGVNLFHSFETFSPGSSAVLFDLQLDGFGEVEHIFSRVTGADASQIDGLLQTVGGNHPDLFLLNPNGLLLGPNARLELGGSFIATTAEAVTFGDGGLFSAIAPSPSALLSLSMPVGLQLGRNAGAISFQGPGHQLPVSSFAGIIEAPLQASAADYGQGLTLAPGNTLALVGNRLQLQGGALQSQPVQIPGSASPLPQGGVQFSLGSGRDGWVALSPDPQWGWSLDYGGLAQRSDILLAGRSRIDGSGLVPSTIQLQGEHIALTSASAIYSNNLGTQPGGAIRIDATGSVQIDGSFDPQVIPSQIRSTTLAPGAGSAIDLRAASLTLQDGGRLVSDAFAAPGQGRVSGSSGDIQLRIGGDILLQGRTEADQLSPFLTFLGSTTIFGGGDSGKISLQAQNLTLDNGAVLSSGAIGSGSSGDLDLMVAGSIVVQGARAQDSLPSNISTSSFTDQNAGSITIDTARLRLAGGGVVEASAYGAGDAGDVTIRATDSVVVNGLAIRDQETNGSGFGGEGFRGAPSAIASQASASRQGFAAFDLPFLPSGKAGSVVIETPRLELSNRGRITVTNQGTGDAGELQITAAKVALDNGFLIAETAQGNGGNVRLQVDESLLLRRNSNISATAGLVSGLDGSGNGNSGNGGNITVSAQNIVAVPQENSDVTAKSFGSSGGRITLNTNSILGLAVREPLTPLSDLNASSALGLEFDGMVELVQPTVLPNSALVALPEHLADGSERLAESCNVGDGEFQIAGRGGLARSPRDLLEPQPLSQTDAVATQVGHDQGSRMALREAAIEQHLAAAIALRDQGFYPKALTELQSLYQSGNLSDRAQVQILRQLGITFRLLGQFDAAREALEQSLGLAEQGQWQAAAIAIQLSLGHLAQTQGQVEQAKQWYQQVLEGAEAETDTVALLSLLRLEQSSGGHSARPNSQSGQQSSQQSGQQSSQWQAQLQQRLAALPQSPGSVTLRLHGIAVQLESLEMSRVTGKDPAGREDAVVDAAAIAALQTELNLTYGLAKQQGDEQAIAYSLGYLGKLAELSQDWAAAQRYSEAALQIAQRHSDAAMQYQWAWQLGKLARSRWEQTAQPAWLAQSKDAYELALAALKSLRSDLVTGAPELQFSFRAAIEPVYREYVDLLLHQPVQDEGGGGNQPLQMAIDTIEALRLAELDNYLQDACLTAVPQSVAARDAKAAVIYPILLEDRLEILVTLANGELSRYRLPVPRTEVEQTVKDFRSGLVLRSQRSFKQPGQQLYDWLIEPIRADLQAKGIETLVMVPDGPLKNIPLGALWDGQQYLIEQFNLAVSPSIQLLPAPSQRKVRGETLTAGLTQEHQGFSKLPYVAQELEDIQAAIPGHTLLNEQFTRESLQRQLETTEFPIVHIATHGQFSSQASDTFVLAWNEQISLTELGNILQGQARQGLTPTELLVLSACETAVEDEIAALGLAGVAVRAGARSTLASLWSVNDQSTAALMSEFYQQLAQPQMGKAEALRQTQLAMLQDPVYQHPYYWSAFVLLGDWQ